MSEPGSPRPRRRLIVIGLVAAAALIVLTGAALGLLHWRDVGLGRRLLAAMPNAAASQRDLVEFAVRQGRPLFARECAACHGTDMKGMPAIGAPNLTDQVWLYGDGSVFEIERTILYGIRSGHKKSHNVTEMPAYGLRGLLGESDINALAQYLLRLSGRPADNQAAELGKAVYSGTSNCGDCHGADAKGSPDYGSTDLTANAWNFGGSPRDLYNSIYYGRHGKMPAWIGKLTLEQIRALSVYVYSASHR